MADPNIAMSRTESPATQSFHTVCIVKDYVREQGLRSREVFVPLSHSPGHAQADFGEAMAVIGGALRSHSLHLPHSDGCFVAAYPAETTEAFCDGHNAAFAFFGGVPRSILYDDPSWRLPGSWAMRQRTRVFRSFSPTGSRTGSAGRARATTRARSRDGPSPALPGLPRAESSRPSTMLSPNSAAGARRRGCDKETIGERLERDRQVLLPLPPAPYDACDKRSGRASSVAGALPQQRLFRARGLRPPGCSSGATSMRW